MPVQEGSRPPYYEVRLDMGRRLKLAVPAPQEPDPEPEPAAA
ncbi:hypothetical protein ACWEPI_13910 [Streptomyces sp. NPDC004262]